MNDEALLHLCASAPTILCGKLLGIGLKGAL